MNNSSHTTDLPTAERIDDSKPDGKRTLQVPPHCPALVNSTDKLLPPVATREGARQQNSAGRAEIPTFSAAGLTLYLGDWREHRGLLVGVDAIVTDPPYGHGWSGVNSTSKGGRNWTRRRAEKIIGHDEDFDPAPVLEMDVPTVLWGANHYASRLPDSPAWLAWDKREGTADNNLSDCELAWCNVGGSARLFRHMWNGLCRASEVGVHLHPTQKPVVLMAWCMEKAQIPVGALVADMYFGSGTTAVACLRTNRRFVGFEKEPAHYEAAIARIERELSQLDFFTGGGGGFSPLDTEPRGACAASGAVEFGSAPDSEGGLTDRAPSADSAKDDP